MKILLLALIGTLGCVSSRDSNAENHSLPDTMLAAAIDQGGGPEVLSIHRLPVPASTRGKVQDFQ